LGCLDRSDRGLGHFFSVSSRSRNSLILSPNWMFYICILIVSTRATQWWSQIWILTKSPWLVWPVSAYRSDRYAQSWQFRSLIYAPFFGNARMPKNNLLDQNWLRAMTHRPYICAKGDKILSTITWSTSSWCWSNLLRPPYLLGSRWPCWYYLHRLSHKLLLAHLLQPSFLVWDKPEGHHLGCKYLKSSFTFFSPSLLQSRSFLTRFWLATIGLCDGFGYIEG